MWAGGTAHRGSALDPTCTAGVARLCPGRMGQRTVDERLRAALDHILAAAAADGVRVVLAIPPTNLSYAPEHPLAGPGRSGADAAAADQWIAQARRAPGGQALAAWTGEQREWIPIGLTLCMGGAWSGWRSAATPRRRWWRCARRSIDYSSRRPTGAVRDMCLDERV